MELNHQRFNILIRSQDIDRLNDAFRVTGPHTHQRLLDSVQADDSRVPGEDEDEVISVVKMPEEIRIALDSIFRILMRISNELNGGHDSVQSAGVGLSRLRLRPGSEWRRAQMGIVEAVIVGDLGSDPLRPSLWPRCCDIELELREHESCVFVFVLIYDDCPHTEGNEVTNLRDPPAAAKPVDHGAGFIGIDLVLVLFASVSLAAAFHRQEPVFPIEADPDTAVRSDREVALA
ncbi:hypothetical protein [Blastococcus sp. TF02A-35]|uniref:hypothetical protein n=1 Tax=Blastococcus sp. TF02A-35 TaxID=2559612 RepID=UPI001FD81C66|nr:hypothetical protein [Blastococcus sp. TF02A_35]